jgi:hypothetical protein
MSINIQRGAGGLADNSVTLAKMASGTDGNIISYDASGDPVAIATGNDGEVLTSAGSGNPPAFGAAAGGPSQANQAALEAETNQDTYAPPDLMKHHPGVAKAWCDWTQISTQTINASYNITSITDEATGHTTITLATDMSSVNYAVAGGGGGRGSAGPATRWMLMAHTDDPTVTAYRVRCINDGDASFDVEHNHVVFFGDQS